MNKVSDSISVTPTMKTFAEQYAARLSIVEGKRVSKSDVYERLLGKLIEEDKEMTKLVLRKVVNGGKSIKQLKAEKS